MFDEDLSKIFENTYQLCDGGIDQFCLMLQKGVYPYEYMDGWERFNETLPTKRKFYSNLAMDSITDADYEHAKGVGKDFGLQNLGQYHDLYAHSHTLLLSDVFKVSETGALKFMN